MSTPASRHLLRPLVALLPALGLLLTPACRRAPADPADALPQEVFSDLGAYFSPDYPRTDAQLQACRSEGRAACVASAEKVAAAQARLLEHGQEPASRAMLQVLSMDCAGLAAGKLSAAERAPALERCRGAGVALSLIDEPALDARFRRYFTYQQLELRGLMLVTGGEPWAHARPEPAAWAALLRAGARQRDGGTDEVWERLAREVESPTQRHARPLP